MTRPLRSTLALVLLAGGLIACRGSGCADQGGNPCFDPQQNRPVVPGGATVALAEQGRPSPTCLNGWGDLTTDEPLRAVPLAAFAAVKGGAGVTAGRVRVFIGRDVEGQAAQTVTRFVLEVTAPAASVGDWLVQLPGIASADPTGMAGVTVVPVAQAVLPATLLGCLPA